MNYVSEFAENLELERLSLWFLCASNHEALTYLEGHSILRKALEVYHPQSKILELSAEGLVGIAEKIDRQIAKSVRFGRPPGGFEFVDDRQNQKERPSTLKRTDYNQALWLAVTDPQFRQQCFGDARNTLKSHGLALSEEELGKFQWFDPLKLASFGDELDLQLSSFSPAGPTLGTSTLEESDASHDVKLKRLYLTYVKQIDAIRFEGMRLAESNSELSLDEFDPGPPAHDYPTFLSVLNSWRIHGADLDAICLQTGMLLGRVLSILGVIGKASITLPPHKGLRPNDASQASAQFGRWVYKHRPPLNEIFHQSPCSPEAVIDRVISISENNWLLGKKVIVLGDDDGISVAIAKYTEVSHVTVLDIDPAVITFLTKLAAEAGVEIDIRHQDLREPIPEDLAGQFWLANADPPQNHSGELFFLNKAIDLLDPGLGHRIYSSITPMWMGFEAFQRVQSFLLGRGFVTRDILKSMMVFPVASPSDQNGSELSASSNLVESALCDVTNMACDVHVLQRARFL